MTGAADTPGAGGGRAQSPSSCDWEFIDSGPGVEDCTRIHAGDNGCTGEQKIRDERREKGKSAENQVSGEEVSLTMTGRE